MKISVELCINKLPGAAAKSELKANCEKFDSKLGERRTKGIRKGGLEVKTLP